MIRPEILSGILSLIAESGPVSLDAIGVNTEGFKVVTGPTHWRFENRQGAKQTLEQLLFGTLDVAGFPRFEVPAEYTACVIAHYVAPVNWLNAAALMEGGHSTEDLGAQGVGEREKASAAQLFALMMSLNAATIQISRDQFMKRSKLKLERLESSIKTGN